MGRNTQGVKLTNLKEGDYLVVIQKIEGSEESGNLDGTPPSEEGALTQDTSFESVASESAGGGEDLIEDFVEEVDEENLDDSFEAETEE